MADKKTDSDEINRLFGKVFKTSLNRKNGLDEETAKEAIRLFTSIGTNTQKPFSIRTDLYERSHSIPSRWT